MLNRVTKNTMKRMDNNSSVDLLQLGFEDSVKFNPILQKEMEEERDQEDQ